MIPKPSERVIDGDGFFSPAWRRWLASLERGLSQSDTDASGAAADIAALARALGSPDGTVESIPAQPFLGDFVIRAGPGIGVLGTPSGGLVVISATAGSSPGLASVLARISLRA